MARTSTIQTLDELKTLQRKFAEQRDRYFLGVIQSHKREPSIVQKKIIREKSLFGYLATFWKDLTPTQKNVWRTASAYSSLTNWQLFISDNAARIRNELTLDIPPSDLWQVRAGHIVIESPASEIILKQEHPQEYLVAQKITGTPWKKQIVSLTENFGLPLQIALRYKSDLSASGPTQSARFYAQIWTTYQGQDIYQDFGIDIDPSTDWTYNSVTVSSLRGIILGYTLFLEISGYTGELLYDNPRAIHGGTNWALDPRCDEINKTYSGAFALVPPFWIPVSLPSGASYSSVYPPSLS